MEIIVQYGPWFVGLALIFGLYMTWGVGANDLANAMGTSVGAKALTVKQAISLRQFSSSLAPSLPVVA